ncbi:hypothetical protein HYW83_05785 [Candidatus Peregrinibacteria bacterium]|nr:hypothetical protein [Candidatus Peregrinibacteria bacterium]
MTPEAKEDPALSRASAALGRGQSGIIRNHRGKLGLAVGLAAGLAFSPKIKCSIVAPEQISAAQHGVADPETQSRILGVLACTLDANGERVCFPLTPDMLDELEESCEPPAGEIQPNCFPGAEEQPKVEKPGVSL